MKPLRCFNLFVGIFCMSVFFLTFNFINLFFGLLNLFIALNGIEWLFSIEENKTEKENDKDNFFDKWSGG